MTSILMKILFLGAIWGSLSLGVSGQDQPALICEMARLGLGTADAISWHPNGSLLTVGGSLGLSTYDENLQLVNSLAADEPIQAAAWSADGNYLATSSANRLSIWRVRDPQDASSFDAIFTSVEHTQLIRSIQWHPKSPFLATTSNNETFIRDIETGQILYRYNAMFFQGWSPDGDEFAMSDAFQIQVISLETGDTTRAASRGEGRIEAIIWENGEIFVVSQNAEQGEIRVWNLGTGAALFSIQNDIFSPYSLVFIDPLAKYVIFNTEDGLQFWDRNSQAFAFALHTDDFIHDLSWNVAGNKLATIDNSHRVQVWDITNSTLLATNSAHMGSVFDVEWSPNSLQILSADSDNLRVWDATTGDLTMLVPDTYSSSVSWNPDGSQFVTASRQTSDLYVWDAETYGILQVYKNLESDFPELITDLSWSSDGELIASNSLLNEILVWDLQNGSVSPLDEDFATSEGIPGISIVRWSGNGSSLATVDVEGNVFIWDMGTRAIIQTLPGYGDVAWRYDGELIALAHDYDVQIWNVDAGTIVKTLEGHTDFIRAIDWNRDGNLLATASSVGEIRLWDVESEVSDVVIEQSPFVSALEWSPNDNRFAVGRADGAILIIKCDG